jgi:biotin synthase
MTYRLQARVYSRQAGGLFYGDTLLTTPNAGIGEDAELFSAIADSECTCVSETAA